MKESSIVVGVASLTATLSLLCALLVLPQLYWELHELREEVVVAVEQFKEETDLSWVQLMDVQLAFTPPSKPRENPLTRREKRFAGLPDHCQCDAMPQCPQGPPGPPGAPGEPGTPGTPGPRGMDIENLSQPSTYCAMASNDCIKCPEGEPGPPGPDGPPGAPGPEGNPGLVGTIGNPGQPGPQGAPGDQGLPGHPGQIGAPGAPGKNTEVIRSRPGAPGRPGDIGEPGPQGTAGTNGQPGTPGAEGPRGEAGRPGKDGLAGIPGAPGGNGLPGHDAEYCPCPPRSMVYYRRKASKL